MYSGEKYTIQGKLPDDAFVLKFFPTGADVVAPMFNTYTGMAAHVLLDFELKIEDISKYAPTGEEADKLLVRNVCAPGSVYRLPDLYELAKRLGIYDYDKLTREELCKSIMGILQL